MYMFNHDALLSPIVFVSSCLFRFIVLLSRFVFSSHNTTTSNRFHILTWNVSSKFPENLPIHVLLGLEKKADTETHRPDFFVIG